MGSVSSVQHHAAAAAACERGDEAKAGPAGVAGDPMARANTGLEGLPAFSALLYMLGQHPRLCAARPWVAARLRDAWVLVQAGMTAINMLCQTSQTRAGLRGT